MSPSRIIVPGILLAAIVAVGSAEAQPLVLDPSPSTPLNPPPAAPSPAASAPADSQASGDGDGAEAEIENAYFGDYLTETEPGDDNGRIRYHGVVPSSHNVRSGDTLWDISAYYFADPWSWPKVWGLNPEIADPHWIYPGNVVRLRDGGDATGQTPQNNRVAMKTSSPEGYALRQHAYVDIDELKHAGMVDGSTDAKSLLATGDSIYITYEDGKLPKVGTRLTIYKNPKEIKRDGKAIGAYVEVTGELVVSFARDGKRARAEVVRSMDAIERGMLVGPLKLKFEPVTPVANQQKLAGSVLEVLGPDFLIGANAAVIIDKGSNDGVKAGNRFLVIRRGDAYKRVMSPGGNVGQDDDEYPARAIGEVMVLEAGKSSCIGVVTFSVLEFEPGDHVFMRKGQ